MPQMKHPTRCNTQS